VGALDRESQMGHRQRWYVINMVYEVTIRTLFGQFWLRPDPACRAIIDGVFGKALALYKAVRLHAYKAQSNHLHFVVNCHAMITRVGGPHSLAALVVGAPKPLPAYGAGGQRCPAPAPDRVAFGTPRAARPAGPPPPIGWGPLVRPTTTIWVSSQAFRRPHDSAA